MTFASPLGPPCCAVLWQLGAAAQFMSPHTTYTQALQHSAASHSPQQQRMGHKTPQKPCHTQHRQKLTGVHLPNTSQHQPLPCAALQRIVLEKDCHCAGVLHIGTGSSPLRAATEQQLMHKPHNSAYAQVSSHRLCMLGKECKSHSNKTARWVNWTVVGLIRCGQEGGSHTVAHTCMHPVTVQSDCTCGLQRPYATDQTAEVQQQQQVFVGKQREI
jgi:hypothetical protein